MFLLSQDEGTAFVDDVDSFVPCGFLASHGLPVSPASGPGSDEQSAAGELSAHEAGGAQKGVLSSQDFGRRERNKYVVLIISRIFWQEASAYANYTISILMPLAPFVS